MTRLANTTRDQWGKDRPPTGTFDATSPYGQAATPTFPQQSPATYGFPQYSGGPMSPQGGPQSAPMSGYHAGPSHQSPIVGPNHAAGRGYPHQGQGGYPSAGYAPQGYQAMQMPGSAGGYGQEQHSASGWSQQASSGYGRGGPSHHNPGSQFGGY